jgi:hypothetical protein
MSVTVVYPNPGKFDNVKATLTMVSNQVRVKTDVTSGYPEQPVGSDSRFAYNYAAVPQKIAIHSSLGASNTHNFMAQSAAASAIIISPCQYTNMNCAKEIARSARAIFPCAVPSARRS